MAATVTLTVELNDKGILTRLNELDAAASKLQGKKITIDINGGHMSSAVTQLTNLSNAQARLATEAQRTAQAQVAAVAQIQAAQQMSQAQQAQSAAQTAQMQVAAQAQVQTAVQQTAQMQAAAQASMVAAVQQGAAAQVTAQAQVQAAMERTTQAQLNLERAQVSADARNQASAARVRVQELRNEGAAAREAANGWSVLGGAVSTAMGHLASRAIHAAVNKVSQALREALTTMKDVDKELANIQKVTNESDDVISQLGDTAYETASKYGIAANDFLASSAEFAKAGYDNYSAMAELATKTQLVGDVSADVASKFLLSADAAYKFGGDIGKLSTVLDKANTIENNYATSIEKLAAGFPVVANTAAMANMSIDETMAAIGTITAVTQEGGAMAARALRALILNILKDTTTEVEDGVTVTKDQINSLQDALKKYAPEVVKAAEATGKIIDPMEAIGALSKAWQDGLLNEQELAAMVTDIGGKLRANQLLALIKNFDMFNEMLDKSKDSAGSADKEMGVMLGTWEAKTNILKNTWTEFVADIVETDTIKGGLDWLTDLISDVDKLVEKLTNPFDTSDKTKEQYASALAEMKDLESRAGSLNGVEQRRLQLLREITAELEKQAGIQAKQDAENLNKSLLKDQWAQYDENGFKTAPMRLSGDQARLNNLYGEYRDAATEYTNTGDITAFQDGLKGIVSTYGDYYDQLVRIRDAGVELNENQEAFIGEYEGIKSASEATITDVNDLGNGLLGLYDAQGNLIAQVQKRSELEREQAERAKEAQEEQAAEIEAFEEAANAFDATYSTNAEVEQQALDALRNEWNAAVTDADNATTSVGDLTTGSNDAASATESVADAAGGIDFSAATTSAGALTGELRAAAAAAAAISVGPMGGLLGVGFATGTKDAPGGPTVVNELGPELISENGRAYIANGGKPGVVNLSKGAIVLTARETRDALRGGNGAVRNMHAAAGGVAGGFIKGGSTASAPGAVMFNGANIATLGSGANLNITIPRGMSIETKDKREKYERRKGNGGVGGGGTPAKTVEDLAKETKDILSNLEKQAKLADNRKQYDKEASLYAQGQKEIDKMVAAYKKAGYKETDDEVLDLLNKRYDYEKKKDAASKKTIEEAAKELKDKLSNLEKQADVAEKQEDYLSQVKFYEQAQEAIKTMVERYRKAGYKDDSDEILDLLKKNYDYADKQVNIYKDRWNELIDALETDTEQQELANALAEKQQALEDARLSLENAQKQRTIRTYNASTGQWEWVRDEAKVKSAQESLTKAEKDYADEVKDQAIQEIEKMRDTLADLNDVVLGPALTSVMAMAESSNEFQNFARALNAVYGVGSYLSSTEGSSRVISTANDSHDTIYTFGNVTLTEEQASTMSVAQLAQKLQVLKIS